MNHVLPPLPLPLLYRILACVNLRMSLNLALQFLSILLPITLYTRIAGLCFINSFLKHIHKHPL